MWLVETKKMCSQHLLGEHVEMHMFVGVIKRGTKIFGYVSGGLVESHRIAQRHQELAEEMTRRGMKHSSPLPEFTLPEGTGSGSVNVLENEAELRRRCQNCKF
jgi:xanthine/CO dehydrogenase XdhC/CoxF family maturation factor